MVSPVLFVVGAAVVVAGVIAAIIVGQQKARKGVEEYAAKQGWKVQPTDPSLPMVLEGFEPATPWRELGTGWYDTAPQAKGRVQWVVSGTHEGVPFRFFRYSRRTVQQTASRGPRPGQRGPGQRQGHQVQTTHHAVLVAQMPQEAPDLRVRRTGWVAGAVQAAVGLDINFADDPQFSLSHEVQCKDEAFARRLLTPELRATLGLPKTVWQWRGTAFVMSQESMYGQTTLAKALEGLAAFRRAAAASAAPAVPSATPPL